MLKPKETVGVKRTFQLQQHKEACAGYVKTRVSEQKRIHDPSIHDQDLSDPAKEIRNVSRILKFLNGSIKNKCVDMVYVHVFVDESSHSSWTELLANLEVYKNTNFEEIERLFNITRN